MRAEPTTPELTLGSLVLHPPERSGYSNYTIEASSDGTDWGEPQAVTATIRSLLQDGTLAAVNNYDNRTVEVHVRIVADNYDGLALGEEVLMAEVRKPANTLTWLPPQVEAVATVFDVVTSTLTFSLDALTELRLQRSYVLTLNCLPFARSVGSALVPALPLPPPAGSTTTVSVDACTATTGWTGSSTVTTSGGAVQVTTTRKQSLFPSGIHSTTTGFLLRTGSVTMGATPYLMVEVEGGITSKMTFTFDNVAFTPAMKIALSSTITRLYFQAPASFSTFKLDYYSDVIITTPVTAPLPVLKIHDISRTDALFVAGTTRQRGFTVAVSGSARTQASLEVYDATPTALGAETLVYTRKSGPALQPDLRRWLVTSQAPTVDATLVSGVYNTLYPVATALEIPADLVDEGTYALMAHMRAVVGGGASATLDWSATLRDPGMPGADVGIEVSGSTVIPGSTAWGVFDLARLTLPTVRVRPGTKYVVRVELSETATSYCQIDEVWLFNLDNGALSWVDTSSDGDMVGALQINAATIDTPRPHYLVAPGTADWDNGRSADHRVRAWGTHSFEPGEMDVWVMTTGSLNAQASLAYPPRWHTHARF